MDGVQAAASAIELASAIVGAVRALEQATHDMEQAPAKARQLEELVTGLEVLVTDAKLKYIHKIHHSQLHTKIESLRTLVERIKPKVKLAKKVSAKKGIKRFTRILWHSLVGDTLARVVQSIKQDINLWVESQQLSENVQNIIGKTAKYLPPLLKIRSEEGYPIFKKGEVVKDILCRDDAHRVVMLVGLSGIGKTSLARQVASDPPERFSHGAVELCLGQWCSRVSCGGNKAEYQVRLARKISNFLIKIGGNRRVFEEAKGDLEEICFRLQEALLGRKLLILLDDVWEPDIIYRFSKLDTNDCRYLATARNEAVYEVTAAEKIEISKEDTCEVSKDILLYHSQLTDSELPDAADSLLNRCGHHPLTVAVIGKALRKERRPEKWEKAIRDLKTYASFAPAPLVYLNEKDTETTATVYGSFEFSLEAMPCLSRDLFIAFAALSWDEPVPEVCLEAVWSALAQDSSFLLVSNKLTESSLLSKGNLLTTGNAYVTYHIHDMVSLYLENKINDAIKMLLTSQTSNNSEILAPWLFVFGKEEVKRIAEKKLQNVFKSVHNMQAEVVLEAIVHALHASQSVIDLEASSLNIRNLIGPFILELLSKGAENLMVATVTAMSLLLTAEDYFEYLEILENVEIANKLTKLMESSDDPMVIINVAVVFAGLANCNDENMANEIVDKIPLQKLVNLLDPDIEELHDSLLHVLMSMTKAGKEKCVEKLFTLGMGNRLLGLLNSSNEIAHDRSIIALKSFYDHGGSMTVQEFLNSGITEQLPWLARLSLDNLSASENTRILIPEKEELDRLASAILDRNSYRRIESLQNILVVVENANVPQIRAMILETPIIENLAKQLSTSVSDKNGLISSEGLFILMNLGSTGGQQCIRKMVKSNIVENLVSLMSCRWTELQDTAYMALHKLMLAEGGNIVVGRMLATHQINKVAKLLEWKSPKANEIGIHCLEDLVLYGGKSCIEQMLALSVVENLAMLEKSNARFSGAMENFIKAIDKCKHLTRVQRQVLKQQMLKNARTTFNDVDLLTSIATELERSSSSEGSSHGSRRRHKQKKV